MSEKQIQNQILREFATRLDMRLWRANSGVGFYKDRAVRYGVPGQADLTGILPDGRRLEIEVKKPFGRVSDQQAKYGTMIKKFGGVYIVASSAEEVYEVIGGYLR